jgi:hypothetical protein
MIRRCAWVAGLVGQLDEASDCGARSAGDAVVEAHGGVKTTTTRRDRK